MWQAKPSQHPFVENARLLLGDGERDPLALALVDYDLALTKIVREGRPQIVTFPGNPGPVFEALAAAQLPAPPEPPEWEIEILPDSSHDRRLRDQRDGKLTFAAHPPRALPRP